MITVDDKRGIAFLPFTGPGPDRWGGDRHGANLFGNSLVAVDAMTGKRLWHFQLLHHEIWDWDQPTPPMLFDVKKNGKTIPAVAAMNKSGYLFILDRLTGKPLYDVKEVPVPKSNAEDEETWPTQPIPVTPPPLAKQSFAAATDVTTITPELHDFCEKLIKTNKLHDSVPFSPLTSDSQIARFPGSGGGPEWGGGAFDPKLGYFIVNTQELGSIEKLEKKKDGYWASANIPDSFFDQEIPGHGYYPCQNPPWGDLWAGERQYRRDRLARQSGRQRHHAGRQARYRPAQSGRAADHGRRTYLHRRHRRQPLPRLRYQDRQGDLDL